MGAFKEPHGGTLQELYLSESKADEEKLLAKDYKSWDLTQRQICDLDLLMSGAFSPLDGFLCEADYESVCDSMRLQSGVLWPIPINLDVTQAFADELTNRRDHRVARSGRGPTGDAEDYRYLDTRSQT